MACAVWPPPIRSIVVDTPAVRSSATALITRERCGRGCWEPFITAYVKVNRNSEGARRQAAEWLAPLQEHLSDGGLGHISEILDGDAPQRPCGCIAQAWSVAEILRAYVEDVKGIRPARPIESPALPAPAKAKTKAQAETGVYLKS